MRIEQTQIQRAKAFLHVGQGIITFIAACLALSILTKAGSNGRSVGFYFALCFLTIPALVYQTMVPIWSRAWRFANVHAYVAIDALFAILWFSALVSMAVWVDGGIREGRGDARTGSCASFGYGSISKCEVGRASIGMGVLLWLLWCATTGISVHHLLQYRRTGSMPGRSAPDAMAVTEPSGDVWSSKIEERDEVSIDDRRRYGQPTDEDEGYGSLRYASRSGAGDTQTEHGLHPGRALSYGSSSPSPVSTPAYEASLAPSALSPTSEETQANHGHFSGMGAGMYGAGPHR
nr:hypothetical protein B0A51_18006 [Rachicladosporium sp. CCFEE 5018]